MAKVYNLEAAKEFFAANPGQAVVCVVGDEARNIYSLEEATKFFEAPADYAKENKVDAGTDEDKDAGDTGSKTGDNEQNGNAEGSAKPITFAEMGALPLGSILKLGEEDKEGNVIVSLMEGIAERPFIVAVSKEDAEKLAALLVA